MSTKIKFQILQRTRFVSWTGHSNAEYIRPESCMNTMDEQPGRVTSYLKERIGTANDYLIDVIVDGARIQSHSGADWINRASGLTGGTR